MASFASLQKLLLIGLALSFSTFASARVEEPRPKQYCVYACQTATGFLTFNTSSSSLTEEYYTALCSNTLLIDSVYLCAQAYCTKEERHAGLSLFNNTCKWEASIPLPPFHSVVNSSVDINSVERVPESAFLAGTVFNNSIIVDQDFWTAGFVTTASYANNIWLAHDFAYAFYAFWALVVLVGTGNRLLTVVAHKKSSAPSSSKLWTTIRRNLILPATFGRTCQDPVGWCTIPPRLESITLIIYIIMNVIFCFPGYSIVSNNLYWAENKEQLSRYISDRAGILAIANLPLVWLFATRNSPLLWVTGWSFATFNRFHRWVARMATALAVSHAVGYTVYSFYTDYYFESWSEQYWYCGVIALCSMAVILGTSVYYLRRHHYDLFLNVHIVLAVVCTAALFYHVKIFNGMYNGFLWPCVAIWGFDRVLRLGRIIANSVLPRRSSKVTAIATYDASSDTIRVDVTDFLRGKAFAPGSFYYVYAPSAGLIQFYESHPFTLCSWNRQLGSSHPTSPIDTVDFEKSLEPSVKQVGVNDITLSEEAHTFVIRPQSGMTRRLRKKIQSSSEANSCQIPLLLEGPYGADLNLSGFSDVLAVVGGVGICEAITLAHTAVAAGASVRISWAVRGRALVDDICANELSALLDHPRFRLTAFVTGTDDAQDKISSVASYEIRSSRPDIEAEMRTARHSAARSLAVVSCGPGHMADSCRQAAVRLLGEDGVPMDYFNHSMGW